MTYLPLLLLLAIFIGLFIANHSSSSGHHDDHDDHHERWTQYVSADENDTYWDPPR